MLLLLAVYTTCSASPAQQSPALSDLRDFGTIEKLMPFGDNNGKPGPEQLYFRSLRNAITKAPVSDRLNQLNKLTNRTVWGTAPRFIASYVCAWYGVNYDKARDYLTHATFWWEWRIGPESSRPFSFDDVGVDLLYALYEHNHDFKILHDILTTQSDAGTSELIVCLTQQAIAKHPRGVLHVAELSNKGYKLAWDLLHLSPRNENNPLYILDGTEASLKAFHVYVTKVANTPSDPLGNLAKELLRRQRRNR